MDSSDFPVSKSPRKELQGPRPAPLKLHKDSYKIKKPPVAPPPQHRHQLQQQRHQNHHPAPAAAPPRPPVIIYTVSPKVIHTNPNDFMTLVQRLTGSSSSSSSSSISSSSSTALSFTSSFASASSSSSSSYDPLRDHSTGAISPAARYASIEKTKQSPTERNKKLQIHNEDHSFIMGGGSAGGNNNGFVEGIEMDHNIERSCLFPGILSPGPTSLPMISPTFFSPPSDPNTFSFLHDLSPVVHGNKNFIEGSYMPSPSGFISPYIPSPTPSIDLFNSFFFDF